MIYFDLTCMNFKKKTEVPKYKTLKKLKTNCSYIAVILRPHFTKHVIRSIFFFSKIPIKKPKCLKPQKSETKKLPAYNSMQKQ